VKQHSQLTGAQHPLTVHSAYGRLQLALVSDSRWRSLVARVGLAAVAGILLGAWIGLLNAPMALASMIALVGGLLMLRSTQVSLIAAIGVICLLPFAALPLNIGFEPTFLDVALILLFVVWFARIVSGEQESFIGTSLTLPVLVFLGLAFFAFVAGLAHSSLTPNTLRRFLEVAISIGLVFAVTNCVRTPRQLRRIVKAITIAGFGTASLGVFFYVLPQEWSVRLLSSLQMFRYPSGWAILRFINDDPERPMRAIGTSVDPNILGALLILVTVLLVPQLFSPNPVLRRVFVVPMLAVMGLCMILTFSRGSLLGLSVAVFLLAAVRYRRLLPILAIVALCILFLPQTQSYIDHFVSGVQGEDRATQMRFGEYKDALILIERYPWIGVGFADAPDIDLYIGVSSLYLLVAEQMGLIGLAAFLCILGVFFIVTWRAQRRAQPDRGDGLPDILLGIQVAIAGALVGGIFDHYLFNINFPHMSAIFWLFMGLGLVAARLLSADTATEL
jgi:polysaccharide biosynthesis protein PslJ